VGQLCDMPQQHACWHMYCAVSRVGWDGALLVQWECMWRACKHARRCMNQLIFQSFSADGQPSSCQWQPTSTTLMPSTLRAAGACKRERALQNWHANRKCTACMPWHGRAWHADRLQPFTGGGRATARPSLDAQQRLLTECQKVPQWQRRGKPTGNTTTKREGRGSPKRGGLLLATAHKKLLATGSSTTVGLRGTRGALRAASSGACSPSLGAVPFQAKKCVCPRGHAVSRS